MLTLTALRWAPPERQGFVKDLRVRWALEEAGEPYQVELVGPEEKSGAAYRSRQPFGQAPAIQDGPLVLFESGAIVQHIAARSAALAPSDPHGWARASAWVFAAIATVEPVLELFADVDLLEADAPWAAALRPAALAGAERRLDDLKAWLGDREHLEDRFTVGDLMMTCVLRNLRDSAVLAARPRLAAYRARCEARPAFRKALRDHLAPFADKAGSHPFS